MTFELPAFDRDSRANRLKAFEFENVAGKALPGPRWLDLCGPEEVAAQIERIYFAAARRTAVPPERRSEWTHRFALLGALPAGLPDLLTFLQRWLTLTKTEYIDLAMAGDWYKRPEEGVDGINWPNTQIGQLVHEGRYWRKTPAKQREAAEQLAKGISALISSHPMYSAANDVLSVPGHQGDGASFGEGLARSVANKTSKQFVQTQGPQVRGQAKEVGSADLVGRLRVPSTLRSTAIIVDDVYRTGGSMRATAYAARQAGAQTVLGFAAVRTMRK